MTHFIQWPDEQKKISNSKYFTICHDASPTKFASLNEWATKGKIKDKQVTLLHVHPNNNELKQCNILYITNSKFLKQYTTSAQQYQLLTFSDKPGYAKHGAMINFFSHEEKLRFEINLDYTSKNGFVIHPRLLNLAKIIDSPEGVE